MGGSVPRREQYASLLFLNGAGISGLPDATEPDQPVTRAQVLRLITEKVIGGQGMSPDELSDFEAQLQRSQTDQLDELSQNINNVNGNVTAVRKEAERKLKAAIANLVALDDYQTKIAELEKQIAGLKAEADGAAKLARQAEDKAAVATSPTAPDGSNQALLDRYEHLEDLIGADYTDPRGEKPIEKESLQEQMSKLNFLIADVISDQEAHSEQGKELRKNVESWFFHVIFSLYEYFSFPPDFKGKDTATVTAFRYHTEVEDSTDLDDDKIQYSQELQVFRQVTADGRATYRIAHQMLTDHLILQASDRLTGQPVLLSWTTVNPNNPNGNRSGDDVWLQFKEEVDPDEYSITIKGRPYEHHT